MSRPPEYDLEDDSLSAVFWRAGRWGAQTVYGVPNAERVVSCATRASVDRHILVEEVRRLRAELAKPNRHR